MTYGDIPPRSQHYTEPEEFMHKPHVVILGAGASKAALPDCDANGCDLPLMGNFLEVIPSVKTLLVEAGLEIDSRDFESTYGSIATTETHAAVTAGVETAIYDYFDALELPVLPTIYDHLVLALREKDVIATFNWDPLLLQAAWRCSLPGVSLPQLLFLHGNVASGFCATDSVHGYRGAPCSHCGQALQPSRLLYPIAEKDYRSDPAIASDWNRLEHELQQAFMVTIFGYSAPVSDRSAIDLLKMAWDSNVRADINEFEIIDIQDAAKLRRTWLDFIHHEHYKVHLCFWDSWIAKHPRRTGEDYLRQELEAEFIADNDVPRNLDLAGTKNWYRGLVDHEQTG